MECSMQPVQKIPYATVSEDRLVVDEEWLAAIKRVVSRFARGSIAAQRGSILTPEEQAAERQKARKIAEKMRRRHTKGEK